MQKSLDLNMRFSIAIVIGAITGVAGGMVGDLLCVESPVVLREDFYSTLSWLDGVVFVILLNYFPVNASGFIALLPTSCKMKRPG